MIVYELFCCMFYLFCLLSFTGSSEAPRIQHIEFPARVYVGGRVSSHCFDTSRSSSTKFSWYKDGIKLESSKNTIITIHDGYSVLIINSVSLQSKGNYTCTGRNAFGSSSYSAVLEVVDPPSWLREPSDQFVSLGSNVTVECMAEGSPKPVITWNGIDLNKTNAKVNNFKSQNGTLMLKSVTMADSGEYECKADNMVTPAIKKRIRIEVNASPQWVEKPVDVVNTAGGAIEVMCVATGSPQPRITWFKVAELADRGSTVPVTSDDKNSSILRISSASYEDAGMYQCIADNGIPPSIKTNFTLTIRGRNDNFVVF